MAAGSVAELRDVLRDALDRSGSLNEIRARLRAEVFNVLHEGESLPKPQPANDNLIINELIREYLIYHGYRETLSVFVPEAGQPTVRPFERSFLAEHLNLAEGPNSRRLPLLYNLVATVSSQNATAQRITGGPNEGPSVP